MLFVAGENFLPILIALLIGFVTGLWVWKLARRPAPRAERVLSEEPAMRRPYVDRPAIPLGSEAQLDDQLDETRPARPRPEPEVLARRAPAARAIDGPEGNDVASGAAAAVEDVADQFLGIDSHGGEGGVAAGTPPAVGDDLQAMKGVGPKLAGILRGQGLNRFDQIAALDADDLARLDAHLGAFKGRLSRDRIVEQAAFLARGDREGYERAFGRL